MNEDTEKETVAQESSWLKFLTLAAMFVGSNSSVMGMGAEDWIGMERTVSAGVPRRREVLRYG